VDGELFRLRGDVFGAPSFDRKAHSAQGREDAGAGRAVQNHRVGLNYADHAREQNKPLPKEPLFWFKATHVAAARRRED
jgi:2-keto-4-pentenoate hydratase/2-oxohepta-3-ene-1,7-dioic acid hydratase in catechol pathway